MNAASLQSRAVVPVAAAPTVFGGGASGGITPATGQSFTPATAAQANQAASAAAPAGAPQGAAPSDGTVDAEQGLTAIMKAFGDELGEPIIGADGSIYMERKKLSATGGKISLSYVLVGTIDKQTKRMKLSPAMVALLQAKEQSSTESQANKKLVKIDDSYVWQTFGKDESGKPVVTEMKAATKEELEALQAKQVQEAAQAKTQDRGDWQQKIGIVSQQLGLFGGIGQFVSTLAAGDDPHTGRSRASVMSGYYLALRLNGKAEGKLLPQWMTAGPVATALEWGTQIYGMLDVGNDIKTLRNYFGHTVLPDVNPNAMQQLLAKGTDPEMAKALVQLGTEIRTAAPGQGPAMQVVSGGQNAVLLNAKEGALQFVDKGSLREAFTSTDPVQSAGLRTKANIDNGLSKGVGLLEKLVSPALIVSSALNLASSVMTLKSITQRNGTGVLLDTQQGRGVVLNAAMSAAFLGLQTIRPLMMGLGVAAPAVGAAMAGASLAVNVLGGVQMLNSYGLFGEKGFLNHDAVRAAFLIPPLTPIGAFSFLMKSRKKKKDAEVAKLEAAKQLAMQQLEQQREMVKLQLQSAGKVAGAAAGKDGNIVIPTTVPQDLSVLAAQMSGAMPATAATPSGNASGAPAAGSSETSAAAQRDAAAVAQQRQQLMMTARPMR